MKINKQNGGIIKWLIVIITIIFLASFFFNFSIQDVVEDDQSQSNIEYIWSHVSNFYNIYLADKIDYLWNNIFIDLIWNNFIGDLENIKAGKETSFELASPGINASN